MTAYYRIIGGSGEEFVSKFGKNLEIWELTADEDSINCINVHPDRVRLPWLFAIWLHADLVPFCFLNFSGEFAHGKW